MRHLWFAIWLEALYMGWEQKPERNDFYAILKAIHGRKTWWSKADSPPSEAP